MFEPVRSEPVDDPYNARGRSTVRDRWAVWLEEFEMDVEDAERRLEHSPWWVQLAHGRKG